MSPPAQAAGEGLLLLAGAGPVWPPANNSSGTQPLRSSTFDAASVLLQLRLDRTQEALPGVPDDPPLRPQLPLPDDPPGCDSPPGLADQSGSVAGDVGGDAVAEPTAIAPAALTGRARALAVADDAQGGAVTVAPSPVRASPRQGAAGAATGAEAQAAVRQRLSRQLLYGSASSPTAVPKGSAEPMARAAASGSSSASASSGYRADAPSPGVQQLPRRGKTPAAAAPGAGLSPPSGLTGTVQPEDGDDDVGAYRAGSADTPRKASGRAAAAAAARPLGSPLVKAPAGRSTHTAHPAAAAAAAFPPHGACQAPPRTRSWGSSSNN